MKITRNWTTPLATGTFLLVGLTGIAMFFHVNSALGKVLHEWLGWALVIAVVLHVVVHWNSLKGYLGMWTGRLIIGGFTLVSALALAPISLGGGDPGQGIRGAADALALVSIEKLAPVTGRPTEALVAELRQGGFPAATAASTCESLAGKDKGAQYRLLGLLFPATQGNAKEGR